MTALAVFVCTFGYVGYVPFASGTAGSAAGLVVFLLIRASGVPYLEPAVIAILMVAGIWSGTVAERYFGRSDPSQGVIDEVAGMLITLFALPMSALGLAAAFVLFRLLDIIKLYPSARFERLPGGFGMMADDAMAAVYGNVVLRLLIIVWPALAQ